MNEQVMPKVGGKSFRCDCGCNVFTKIGVYRYKCNACRAIYQGEPEIKMKSLDERVEIWHDILEDSDAEYETMIPVAEGIITELKAERDTLKAFKDEVYKAYTPNSHYDPAKLEAVLIAHMYEEK